MGFSQDCIDAGSNLKETPVIQVSQRTSGEATLVVRDSNGDPYDLTGKTVQFIAKELYTDNIAYIDKAMAVTNATSGEVKLVYTPADVKYAGAWVAQVSVRSGGVNEFVYPVYFYVSTSLDALSSEHVGVPNIYEIRLAMRDVDGVDNYLLDAVEFKDQEIIAAIRWPIDQWNETPPPVARYTPASFPYRYYWIRAIIGHLLEISAHNYRRNRMDYQVQGGHVDDKNKADAYEKRAQELIGEWKQWLLNKKIEINMSRGWGSTTSGVYR